MIRLTLPIGRQAITVPTCFDYQGSCIHMEGHPYIRFFVVAMLVTIIVTLGSAFVSVFRSKGSGTGTVKALTLRVGLSITLFIVLMVLAALGIIKPH